MKLILRNAAAIATCSASGRRCKRGDEMRDVGVINDADLLIEDGIIKSVGKTGDMPGAESFDVTGKTIVPGFVDAHTHLIFAGTREREFAMHAGGMTYSEIALKGGGILSTVSKTRESSKAHLRSQAARRIDKMLKHGTTTLEIKSGYGLDFKNEIKLLEAANELREESISEIVVTLLGAHAIPPEFINDRDGYLELLIRELIPNAGRKKLAKFCDVFCDEGFFSPDEARRILTAGVESGMLPKMHADELSASGGVNLAIELEAVSVDHLEHISHDEIGTLAGSETVGVILPAVAAYLRGTPAPAREMIDSGCAVALATDLNPGTSMVDNMQTAMFFAISMNRLTVEEALNAATINAAAALGISDRLGSIEIGKQADLLIVDGEDYSILPYHFTENQITNVVKNGTLLEFPR